MTESLRFHVGLASAAKSASEFRLLNGTASSSPKDSAHNFISDVVESAFRIFWSSYKFSSFISLTHFWLMLQYDVGASPKRVGNSDQEDAVNVPQLMALFGIFYLDDCICLLKFGLKCSYCPPAYAGGNKIFLSFHWSPVYVQMVLRAVALRFATTWAKWSIISRVLLHRCELPVSQ